MSTIIWILDVYVYTDSDSSDYNHAIIEAHIEKFDIICSFAR